MDTALAGPDRLTGLGLAWETIRRWTERRRQLIQSVCLTVHVFNQSQELGHAAQSSSDYSFNNEQKKQVLGLNLLRGWGLGVLGFRV